MANDLLDTSSLTDRVADALRDRILTGAFHHGQVVTQRGIAEEFGVSTVPVREAIMRLSFEGLIKAKRARSFTVVRLTEQDVLDMYWVHAQLSREITRRAVASGVDVDELERAHQELIEATDDVARMHHANTRFHRVINLAARSPRLVLMLEQSIRTIPQSFFTLPQWRDQSIHDHAAIIDSAKRGDSAVAAQLAEEHITKSGRTLIQCLRERGWLLSD